MTCLPFFQVNAEFTSDLPALFSGVCRVHLYDLPALLQAYAEKEGEEQLVFLKQRAADVLVDAVGEVVTEVCDPGRQVRRWLTVDNGLNTHGHTHTHTHTHTNTHTHTHTNETKQRPQVKITFLSLPY